MESILRQNKYPIFIFLFIQLVLSAVLIMIPKAELHLTINAFHTPVLDWFFAYVTHLGDGLFIVALAIVLAFFSFRNALILLVAYLSSGLVVQVMKRLIFPDALRPAGFFDEGVLYMIEGVKVLQAKSFPSGHATSAIALGLCLVFMIKNQAAKMFILIVSFLVAFSRVYISQHFLGDIYVGAFIGFLCAFLTWYFIHNSNRPWLNHSFRSLISGT